MNYDEMLQAVKDAKYTQEVFNGQIQDLALLLVGNLRAVSKDGRYYGGGNATLKKLKKELSEFNAATRTWKS